MARLPRLDMPGCPQHVILRGNNRQEIFCAAADYSFFLEKLQAACLKHEVHLHAYVLMTNHVHLLLTAHASGALAKTMQMLGRYYVQHYNHCYRRTGTLWEGRYRATLVDSERYLFTCMRYIELNPVRAGMAGHPSEYPWSSYAANAQGQASPLLQPHDLYRRLDRTDQGRQSAYRQLFRTHLAESTLTIIREATNKAWVLGSDRFKARVQAQLGRRIEPAARGGDRKSERYRKRRHEIDRV